MIPKISLPPTRPYKIKDLLEDERFTIPSYQRPFSWGTNEVNDLMEDIINVGRGNEDLHFFGMIIAIPTSRQNQDKWSLVDGQQRITTSIVLLAVIRNFAERFLSNKITLTHTTRDLNYIISEINLILFGSDDAERKTKFLILQLNSFHNNKEQKIYKRFFDGLIINDRYHPFTKYLNKKYQSIKLLNNAYHIIFSKIQSILDKRKTQYAKANTLYKFFLDFIFQFYVVVMKPHSRPDAMTIYTAINTRGKNLSVPDLVKASLAIEIGQSGQSVQTYMGLWGGTFSSFKTTKAATKFIKLYWEASFGQDVNTRSLPRYITQKIDTAQKAIQMINNLIYLAPIYRELLCPRKRNLNRFDSLDHQIDILKSMGLTHYYPLMLALSYNQNPLDEISQVISIVTKLEMRTALKRGAYPSYIRIAHRFWDHHDDVDGLIKDLNEYLAHHSDSATYQLVQDYQCRIPKTVTSQKYRKISYILACVYAWANNDFSSGGSIYNNIFEHRRYILIHLDNNDQDIVNKLGNCTLIEKNLSSRSVKRDSQRLVSILDQSKLISNHKLAREITDKGSLRNVVIHRQDRIATDFIKIW